MQLQSAQAGQNSHGSGNEHSAGALMALVPSRQATHRAVRNGAWNDPATWSSRQVPGGGDKVFIPAGRTVSYNRDSSEALQWVRVDGRLRFATARDTKLTLDTFVVTPDGEIEIGSDRNPVRAQNSAQIVFTTDGALDSRTDPQRLGRGIISHGTVEIVGADKLDHVALRRDARKGDRELVLDLPNGQDRPRGWQVGDKLVLGGTDISLQGNNQNNSRFQDEVLTITSIQGNRIRFTNDDIRNGNRRVLRFDHSRPEHLRDEVDLYVANISRNVSFSSQNGKTVPTQRRAHAMFMHNPDVTIKNAGFYDLGRTNKRRPIDDPGHNIDGSVGRGTNPRGRYGLHIHKTGVNPGDGSVTVKGNAVVGSPGWGIVQHESKGIFSDNVVFDVVGAGFVTESGNESGWWINNIAIKTTGDGSPAVDPAVLARV
ncbi:MAG: G8 domain-containing protein, partial [Cyanobacteria bacterium P01_F01_bin.42]